jgi:hypothetical protein
MSKNIKKQKIIKNKNFIKIKMGNFFSNVCDNNYIIYFLIIYITLSILMSITIEKRKINNSPKQQLINKKIYIENEINYLNQELHKVQNELDHASFPENVRNMIRNEIKEILKTKRRNVVPNSN